MPTEFLSFLRAEKSLMFTLTQKAEAEKEEADVADSADATVDLDATEMMISAVSEEETVAEDAADLADATVKTDAAEKETLAAALTLRHSVQAHLPTRNQLHVMNTNHKC